MLNGEQSGDVTMRSLTVDGRLPAPWGEQRRSVLIDAHRLL
jgi:hypothetical protein